MSAKDKKQTAKQHKQRKKRIAEFQKYDKQFNIINNDIVNIDQQIKNLEKLKEKKENEKSEIQEKEYKALLKIYNDPTLINKIIEDGKRTTYPASIINELEEKCKKGFNEDNISYDDIKKIVDVDERIHKEFSHTNYITDAISNLGNAVDTSDKKGG